ncbi:hypothetical protein KIW84_063417 [Lathyrus oleraceus]|uniref:Uncharacterized protein n=1 Tax=Pisum sativum TaxID=3888 RepID=A0A9D4WA03_PEA|nr:hypothetical protein KIW84_063417 [Pisum sativum]
MFCPNAVRCLNNLSPIALEFKSVEYIFSVIADCLTWTVMQAGLLKMFLVVIELLLPSIFFCRFTIIFAGDSVERDNDMLTVLLLLSNSIRSAGLILASWLLSIGVENAEVLCLGLVSVAVFTLVLPLFRATGGILLQMAPPSIPTTAFRKCLRQISAREDVLEVSQARFWELVPGRVIGSLSMQVKKGEDDRQILEFVHRLYHDFGVQDLTVQIDYA